MFSFVSGDLHCSCSLLSLSFIDVSCESCDFVLDGCIAWDMSFIYLSGLWTWEIFVMSAMCVIYIVFTFIRTMHVLEWKCMVWCFLFILVWYILSYASLFYFVTYTCTPRMQWFSGSLLCVLVCANWHLRSLLNSIHIAHIKGEPLINHWTQKPKFYIIL
jgi:hypothetical protein